MYILLRKVEKKSPLSGFDKILSDEETNDKPYKGKVLFPKPENSSKKTSNRPITAPKPPNIPHPPKPSKNTDSSSYLKQKPRQIQTDKEKLYEENLELKQKNNSLNDENLRLKTRLFQIEKELNKKEENPENLKASGHLLGSLKQIIKELRFQLAEKTAETELLRKNAKNSKVQELETEIKVYVDECTRLKHHLSEVLKQSDPNFEVSSQVLEKNIQNSIMNEAIRNENQELLYRLESLKQENEGLLQRMQEKKKVKKKPESINHKVEVVKLKNILEKVQKDKDDKENGKDEEIADLKRIMVEYQQELKAAGRTIKGLQDNIDKVNKENADLKRESLEVAKRTPLTQSNPSKKKSTPPKLLRILNRIVTEKKMIFGVFLTLVDRNNVGVLEIGEFFKKLKGYYPLIKRKHIESVMHKIGTSPNFISLSDLEDFYENFEYEGLELSSDSDEEKENVGSSSSVVTNYTPVQVKPADASTRSLETDATSQAVILVETTPKDSYAKDPSEALKEARATPGFLQAVQHIFYRLQLNRVPEKALHNIMFTGFHPDKPVPTDSLLLIFQNPPFSISDTKMLQDFLAGFPNTLTPCQVIINLIECFPQWEILSEVEERVLDQQLNQIISENFEEVLRLCEHLDEQKQLFLTVSQFFSVLQSINVYINEKLQAYIKLLFYSYDLQLDIAPYSHFLQIYQKIHMSPEERALIVRGYLGKIAEVLRKNKISAVDVFSTNDENVITEMYFYEGLERLGLFNVKKEHLEVMLEALQCDTSEEPGVYLDELSEILGHYGVDINQPITEESQSLYSSFESEKKGLSQINESENDEYSESYEQESSDSH